MQNSHERQIVHFHMTVNTSPAGHLPDMELIAAHLIQRVRAGKTIQPVEAERYQIAITHAEITPKPNGGKALVMLFTFADPDAAAAANIHLPTRRVRRLEKLRDEARGYSAHVIMDLSPMGQNDHTYAVLLESAERLGKTRVRQMLDFQFRSIFHDARFVIPDAAGNPVMAKPRITLDTVASEKLRAAARGEAELKQLRLIDVSPPKGFDPPAGAKVRRREMFLTVDVPAAMALEDFLKSIQPWALQEGFEDMYVVWERPPESVPAGTLSRSQTERAKIDLAQADIGETLFARKQFVNLAIPLDDLSTSISAELTQAMLAMWA
ncbi:hypothetical protein [Flavisphingomonas formosensis]|uniref:hypothetical protein n=1 Tax=Flavisphingomonas formosensis TaxID=861534 RepID=UPI0012F895C4|nr:hypothetical protein [Sphingomonas formosensis]